MRLTSYILDSIKQLVSNSWDEFPYPMQRIY